MTNAYLDNLISNGFGELNHAQNAVVCAYIGTQHAGADVLMWPEVIWESDVLGIVKTLRAAGIDELYITNQASNMLDVYLMFDELGLKLRGVVRLENPRYKYDMERWGHSSASETIPAMKLSF